MNENAELKAWDVLSDALIIYNEHLEDHKSCTKDCGDRRLKGVAFERARREWKASKA